MFSLAINALSLAAGQAADAASRNDLDMAETAMNSLASALDVMDLAAQFLEEHCPDTSFDFQRLHAQAKQAAAKARAVRVLAEGEKLGSGAPVNEAAKITAETVKYPLAEYWPEKQRISLPTPRNSIFNLAKLSTDTAEPNGQDFSPPGNGGGRSCASSRHSRTTSPIF